MADMDQKSLDFHIEQNDYFGAVATILDFLRQDLQRSGHDRHAKTLASLRDDLMHLQEEYRIEPA
jgi:hypothetical protein